MKNLQDDMKELTDRQQEIYNYFLECSYENFYQPSIRDIGAYFSITPKGVHDHLRAIERKGFIQLTGKCRAIKILK